MASVYFPAFSEQLASLLPELRRKKVGIIGHIRPDGDCIGSQVALCRMLRAAGVDAIAINQHPIPVNLRTFVADTPFISDPEEPPAGFERLITLDCSSVDRMGAVFKEQYKTIHLCIDHHISNRGFAEINCIDAHASATAEILAGIAIDCDLTIDPITAQALFVGIATDTGQFRYASTTERVFDLTSHLVHLGADAHAASHELYEREAESRIHLLKAYLNTLEFHHDGQIAFGKITQKMFSETGTHREVTEGFIDYARNIDTVHIAALLEEQKDGTVKGSLRSKFPKFKVDVLAGIFNGGGHACAAGFHMNLPFESFPAVFLKEAHKHLNSVCSET